MKGFTLLEVIFSLAIIAILTGMVTTSFRTAQIKKEQQGIVQSITASLEKQKSDSQTGKDGSNYGVRFATSSYMTFKGTAYASTSASNIVTTLDSNFQISETITNSTNVIYFSKLTGGANETATITVSHITDRVPPALLTVESSGAISVIE